MACETPYNDIPFEAVPYEETYNNQRLQKPSVPTVSTFLCLTTYNHCLKREGTVHESYSYPQYAQNVKVNLGHNFRIREEREKGRERKREVHRRWYEVQEPLMPKRRRELKNKDTNLHCPGRIIVCENALILQHESQASCLQFVSNESQLFMPKTNACFSLVLLLLDVCIRQYKT